MDLDNKTKIPLFSALGLIPLLFGGVVWLTNIDAKASRADTKLDKLEQAVIDIAEMKKDIHYIRESIQKEKK
jgi:hypothetical protein